MDRLCRSRGGGKAREGPLSIHQHCGGMGHMIEGSTNVIVGG
jgi:hypothetical protein